MKTRHYTRLILAVLLPLAAVAASSGLVFGQYSCPLQVGSMSASTQNNNAYGSSNYESIQMTVPISMSCSYMGNQLWTVGTVYDTVTNQNLGSNNIVMNPNGGYYSGQLVFAMPLSIVEHLLQVQINIYSSYNSGQYNSLVASSSPTVTIHSSMVYNNNYNSYNYNNNPYYYCNGYTYCNGYSYYYPSHYYYSNGYTYYYYYSHPTNYYSSSCFNGQTIIYYNGAYYYATCYGYHHHH